MIKSSYNPRRVPPQIPVSGFDFAKDVQRIAELQKELQGFRDTHTSTLEKHSTDFEKFIEEKTGEINSILQYVTEIVEVLKGIDFTGKQGEMPVAGVHFPIPENGKDADEDVVAEKVLKKIRQPKDGNTPIIDEEKIIKKVLAKIPPFPKKVEINHDDIVEKVFEYLHSGKKKLSIKHIGDFTDGLEQTIRPIRSLMAGFRGGGDTIKAGTNITLIRNSDGTVSIYAAGGSGFTELSATETPNGSTTVFTFSLASAQPSYIVSDNVWMKATSKAGTVNWTWNAGAKKATLTIPPLDDIYAIV